VEGKGILLKLRNRSGRKKPPLPTQRGKGRERPYSPKRKRERGKEAREDLLYTFGTFHLRKRGEKPPSFDRRKTTKYTPRVWTGAALGLGEKPPPQKKKKKKQPPQKTPKKGRPQCSSRGASAPIASEEIS